MAVAAIIAIDPGSERSAYVGLAAATGETVVLHGLVPNAELLDALRTGALVRELAGTTGTVVVVEEMRSFMASVGASIFDTVRWAGRFEEAAHPGRVEVIGRKRVAAHLTGSARWGDSIIRAALIDRYGGAGGKDAAIGRKAAPGPLYGISRDVWSALAIALTWLDTEGAA